MRKCAVAELMAMAPITTPIESGGTSAHQRLRNRKPMGGAVVGRGAATRAACTRLRAPIESQKGSNR